MLPEITTGFLSTLWTPGASSCLYSHGTRPYSLARLPRPLQGPPPSTWCTLQNVHAFPSPPPHLCTSPLGHSEGPRPPSGLLCSHLAPTTNPICRSAWPSGSPISQGLVSASQCCSLDSKLPLPPRLCYLQTYFCSPLWCFLCTPSLPPGWRGRHGVNAVMNYSFTPLVLGFPHLSMPLARAPALTFRTFHLRWYFCGFHFKPSEVNTLQGRPGAEVGRPAGRDACTSTLILLMNILCFGSNGYTAFIFKWNPFQPYLMGANFVPSLCKALGLQWLKRSSPCSQGALIQLIHIQIHAQVHGGANLPVIHNYILCIVFLLKKNPPESHATCADYLL